MKTVVTLLLFGVLNFQNLSSQVEVYKVYKSTMSEFDKSISDYVSGESADMTPINMMIILDIPGKNMKIITDKIQLFNFVEILSNEDKYDEMNNKFNYKVYTGNDFNGTTCAFFIADYYYIDSEIITLVYLNELLIEFVCKKNK
jgi:hypothetical protein